MKAWHTIVCSGSVAVVVNSAALAACEPFVAYLPVEGRQFEYKDINNDGEISAGDKLIGRDTIFDGDGNEIGRVFLLIDLHSVDGEGMRRSGRTIRSSFSRAVGFLASRSSTGRKWMCAN